jgi:hypothetical protein
MSRSFKKNPIFWWRDRGLNKRLRAKLKGSMEPIPDGGHYRSIVSDYSECCGYTSFDDFAFWQREWCGSDDELHAKWMKTISK